MTEEQKEEFYSFCLDIYDSRDTYSRAKIIEMIRDKAIELTSSKDKYLEFLEEHKRSLREELVKEENNYTNESNDVYFSLLGQWTAYRLCLNKYKELFQPQNKQNPSGKHE